MTSHKLAELLLAHPDLPVATHANNHTALAQGLDQALVGRLETYLGPMVVIGNFTLRYINNPNERVSEVWSEAQPEPAR